MKRRLGMAAAWAVAGLCGAAMGQQENASRPGEVHVEPPTLHCVSVRWPVTGDRNRNAVVEVQYRKRGRRQWKQGYPLFRTMPSPQPETRSKEHTVAGGWMFAGSIVDLTPDTAYEVKLRLRDPDGAAAEKTLTVKTYAEPAVPAGMVAKHVVPGPRPFRAASRPDGRQMPSCLSRNEACQCPDS